MACWTVFIFSAWSSGISQSNSSSSAITSSTVSRESAPRSSTKEAPGLTSPSLTPSCSTTIFLTRSSTLLMGDFPSKIDLLPSCGRIVNTICLKSSSQSANDDFQRDTPLIHVHSAIHVQGRAGSVPSVGRGKERDRLGDLFGPAEPAERDLLQQRFLLRVGQGARHI